MAGRDAGVGEEHLVERRMPIHLHDGPHFNALLMHGQHEVRDALVFGNIPRGARHDDAEVGVVGAGVPHLLTVHDPLVAVEHCSGAEARQVGASARFAEQLAPREFASERRPQQQFVQLVGPMLEQGRCGQRHARTQRRAHCARGAQFVGHHLVGPRR